MGILGRIFRCGLSTLVCVLAVVVGVIITAGPAVAKAMDEFTDSDGCSFFKGMIPAMHAHTPWGFEAKDIPSLANELYVVTGGNVGLGYWTARHLAKAGAAVVLACRSMERCEAAAAEINEAVGARPGRPYGAHCMELDLASFASVRNFVGELGSRLDAERPGNPLSHMSLKGLVLNAGVMMPPFGKTTDGLETQMGVNHFSHFLLTKKLLPRLQAAATDAAPSTVTSVSSNGHFATYAGGVLPLEQMHDPALYMRHLAYGQSKLANVLFTQELATRESERNTHVLANAVHPGAVATDLPRHIAAATGSVVGRAASNWLLNVVSTMIWHPRDASLTAVYAAVSHDVRRRKVTGRYFTPIAREARPHAHARNATLQAWLWQVSEVVTNTAM